MFDKKKKYELSQLEKIKLQKKKIIIKKITPNTQLIQIRLITTIYFAIMINFHFAS